MYSLLLPPPLFPLLKCLAGGTPGYGPRAQRSGMGPAHDACFLVLAPVPPRMGCSSAAFEAALTNLNSPEEEFYVACKVVSCCKNGRVEKQVGSGSQPVFVEL